MIFNIQPKILRMLWWQHVAQDLEPYVSLHGVYTKLLLLRVLQVQVYGTLNLDIYTLKE